MWASLNPSAWMNLQTSYPSLAPREQENFGILSFLNRLSKSGNKHPLRDEKRTIPEEPGDAGAGERRGEAGRKCRMPQGRRWRYTISASNLPLPSAQSEQPSFPQATSGALSLAHLSRNTLGQGACFFKQESNPVVLCPLQRVCTAGRGSTVSHLSRVSIETLSVLAPSSFLK